MNKKNARSGHAADLRGRAEMIACGKTTLIPENLDGMSSEETRQILHELQVHQIELEMQNEELRRTQRELEVSRLRYFDLYDLAPVGYFTISERGMILEANLTAATLLGVDRGALIRQPLTGFILPDDKDIYYRHRKQLFETGAPQTCELRVMRAAAAPCWALVDAVVARDTDGAPACRVVMSDISSLKRAEETLRKSEGKYRTIFESITDVFYRTDNEGFLVIVSPSVEKLFGYVPDEVIGKKLIEYYANPEERNKFLTLLREKGEVKGFEAILRAKNGSLVWISTNAKFYRDEQGKILGVQGVSHDITKRKHAEEQLRQTLESLRKALSTTVQVLVSAVETRDPYTSGHQARSADLARAIATEMGLPQEKIEGIRIAGSIHDIGKMSVPAEILSRPTKLTEIEFALIKEHSRQGFEMLKDVESPWPLAEIVYQHHERMDGSGYPRHLKGEEILIEVRILAVADVVESMASYRPYRPALGLDAALAEIENNKGKLYDIDAVDACLRLFHEKGYQMIG